MTQNNQIDIAILATPNQDLLRSLAQTVGIPDWARALWQHDNYRAELERFGVEVIPSPSNECISHTALIVGNLAILGNFDDKSQSQKTKKATATQLVSQKIIRQVTAPGLFSANDAVLINNCVYIQISENTNHEGAAQAGFFLHENGYSVQVLESENTIPLSKAVVHLDENRLLIQEDLSKHFAFLEHECITVPYEERGATNAIMVNGQLIMPAGYTETAAKLRRKGVAVVEVNVSEFEKMGIGIQELSLTMSKPEESDISLPAAPASTKVA